MAGSLRHHAGGISALLALIREHRGAIEYDLIALGLRLDQLGSSKLSWRDLQVICRYGPTTSALGIAQLGEQAIWTVSDYLLALVTDALHDANWQRGGGKGGRPPRLKRPGVEDKSRQTLGKDPIRIGSFNDWFYGTE